MKKLRRLMAMMVAGLIIGTGMVPALAGNEDAPAEIMDEVRGILKRDYVRELTLEQLKKPTIDEILQGQNDPYTVYMTAEQYKEFVDGIESEFSGIGVYVAMEEGGMRITEPIEGSPAIKSGLRAGDLIIEANGYSLAGAVYEEAAAKTMGEAGTTVVLKIKRDDNIFDVKVTRARVHVPEIKSEVIDGHIGYVDINSFGNETGGRFKKAVDDLKSKNVDSWIFDLRSNGGGYLTTARILAGYFIDTQKAVVVKNRFREDSETGIDIGDIGNGKVIFLINPYSASASEVLSGALKDYEKASFLGNLSFGKGSVQVMYPLSNGDFIKVTIDNFYSPEENVINHVGIEPDLNTFGFDALETAKMLLSGDSHDVKDLKYKIGPQEFYIDDRALENEDVKKMYEDLFKDENLSFEEKSKLLTIKDRWLKAKFQDDEEAMAKWHGEAEALRRANGFSGGHDGEAVISN